MPTTTPPDRWGGLRHPLAVAGAAAVGLAGSFVVAVQRPVPPTELDLTEWINDAPDTVATLLYPIMQLGTVIAPAAVAVGIAWARRDWLLAGMTTVVGVGTWFAAKGVKSIVERDRPLSYLPAILVREGDGSGLGFISGHSAVAAASATMAMAVLPPRVRPVTAVVALLVGAARIIHGVHLPADVVGGWGFGVLMALAGLGLRDLVEARRARRVRARAAAGAEAPGEGAAGAKTPGDGASA